jgi:hypothetical protein
MKTLVTTTILLLSATNMMAPRSAGTSVVWPTPAQRAGAASSGTAHTDAAVIAEKPGASSAVMIATPRLQIGDLEDQACETVLVVPGPDLKPEALAGISEDLTIMCRIFDKALYPGRRSTSASVYLSRGNSLSRLFMQQSGQTQGLYLDGYGSLFFVQVGFPLVPPPQEKGEPTPDESADRVWSQAMNELRGQQGPQEAGEAGPAYDAQKVENLKTTLIKTLRHAANLRVPSQDQITVVVGSGIPTSGSQQWPFRYSYSQRRHVLGSTPNTARRPDSPVADPAATLILRVSKVDVDALAAGQLTAEQFGAKIQTIWSAAQPQAPEPAPPTPAAR